MESYESSVSSSAGEKEKHSPRALSSDTGSPASSAKQQTGDGGKDALNAVGHDPQTSKKPRLDANLHSRDRRNSLIDISDEETQLSPRRLSFLTPEEAAVEDGEWLALESVHGSARNDSPSSAARREGEEELFGMSADHLPSPHLPSPHLLSGAEEEIIKAFQNPSPPRRSPATPHKVPRPPSGQSTPSSSPTADIPRSRHGSRRVVARSENGMPLFLYKHQFGGHMPFLITEKGEVCKPAIPLELRFYDVLDKKFPRLKPFTPEYLGTVKVELNLRDIQESRKSRKMISRHSHDGKASKLGSGIKSSPGALSDRGSASGHSTPSASDDDAVGPKTPKSAEFSKNLWESFGQNQLVKIGSLTQKRIVCNYLILKDLTTGFRRPCVLDVKMGTRQHGEDTPPEKVLRHVAKCNATTSRSMGMRLCGMQVYLPNEKRYLLRDKLWGRTLTRSNIEQALELYFFNGISVRTEVLASLLVKLRRLVAVVKECMGVRFYSSSLLILYEGDIDLESSSADCSVLTEAESYGEPHTCRRCKVDVRMIDFAHSHLDDALMGPDDGYVLGLTNIVELCENIFFRATGGSGLVQ